MDQIGYEKKTRIKLGFSRIMEWINSDQSGGDWSRMYKTAVISICRRRKLVLYILFTYNFSSSVVYIHNYISLKNYS